jgi:hypothetical protein
LCNMIEGEITDSNRHSASFTKLLWKPVTSFTKVKSIIILTFTGLSGTWSEHHCVVSRLSCFSPLEQCKLGSKYLIATEEVWRSLSLEVLILKLIENLSCISILVIISGLHYYISLDAQSMGIHHSAYNYIMISISNCHNFNSQKLLCKNSVFIVSLVCGWWARQSRLSFERWNLSSEYYVSCLLILALSYYLLLLLQSLYSQTCWGRLEMKPIWLRFNNKSYIFMLALYAQHNPPISWLGTGCAETSQA